MNATKWLTLTEFVKHLGKEGKCRVDETPKGWFISLIQADPMAELSNERRLKRDRCVAASCVSAHAPYCGLQYWMCRPRHRMHGLASTSRSGHLLVTTAASSSGQADSNTKPLFNGIRCAARHHTIRLVATAGAAEKQ
jgi:Domain of Kin17 curved DNA-binding protein